MCRRTRHRCQSCGEYFSIVREPCRSPNTLGCQIESAQNQSDYNATPLPFHQHLGCRAVNVPPGIRPIVPISTKAAAAERRKEAGKRYYDMNREAIAQRRNKPRTKEYAAHWHETHKNEVREQQRARDQRRTEAVRESLEEKLQKTTDPKDRKDIEASIRRSDNMKKNWAARKDKEALEAMETLRQGRHATGPGEPEGRVETRGQRRQREESDSPREQERKRRERDEKDKAQRRKDRDMWD